jgi:hypothetical protein
MNKMLAAQNKRSDTAAAASRVFSYHDNCPLSGRLAPVDYLDLPVRAEH